MLTTRMPKEPQQRAARHRPRAASSRSTSEHKVAIVTTDKHFLYLPLYYAHHCDYFGYVPPHYSIEIRDSQKRTDVSAYDALLGRVGSDADIVFAVFDPIFVLSQDLGAAEPEPALLAGLITNAAFWAVDHRSHRVRYLHDLGAYDRIIAYKPGTTSYSIAAKVHRSSNKTTPLNEFIESVERGREVLALTDDNRENTLALSPDILAIDALLAQERGYAIDMALGTTPEYSNVLVTALMTRSDVVQAHPDLARGILQALQRAMMLVKVASADVIEYAEGFFAHGERCASALKRANDAQVFPATIEVSEAHWTNAARAYFESTNQNFDQATQNAARDAFKRLINPYRHLARDAVQHEIEMLSVNAETTHVLRPDTIRGAITIFATLISAFLLGGAAAKWGHPIFFLVVPLISILGFLMTRMFQVPARILRLVCHWSLFVGIITAIALATRRGWSWEFTAGVVLSLFTADLGVLLASSDTTAQQKRR